jgi:hypothetical protein
MKYLNLTASVICGAMCFEAIEQQMWLATFAYLALSFLNFWSWERAR